MQHSIEQHSTAQHGMAQHGIAWAGPCPSPDTNPLTAEQTEITQH
jgi:hypothetical protein